MSSSFLFIFAALWIGSPVFAGADSAKELVERSEMHTRGDSFQASVSMTVHKGTNEPRTITFKTWTQGRDKSVIKILSPVKDRDIGNLRLELNLWQYLPNVDRIVKIPPSMMLQSWMGSDFTNDDLVKTSSLSRDYTHQIEKKELLGETKSVKIICTPKLDAPVTWGKVILWLREPDSVPLKQEYYSENGELIKVMVGSEIKSFGKHIIPTKLTMTALKGDKSNTELHYETATFDAKIDAQIFTQEYIRKPQK